MSDIYFPLLSNATCDYTDAVLVLVDIFLSTVKRETQGDNIASVCCPRNGEQVFSFKDVYALKASASLLQNHCTLISSECMGRSKDVTCQPGYRPK